MPNTGYTPISELQRRQALVESLGRRADKPGFGGLFDAFRGGREERALADAMGKNASIENSEMQMLMKEALGQPSNLVNRTGQPYNYQSPGAQDFSLKEALRKTNQNSDRGYQAQLLQEEQSREAQLLAAEQAREDAQRRQQQTWEMEQIKARNAGYGTSGGGAFSSYETILDADGNPRGRITRYRDGRSEPTDFNGQPIELQPDWTVINSTTARTTPSVIEDVGAASTAVDVANTNALAGPEAAAAGAIKRSEEDVINDFKGREAKAKIGLMETNKNTTIAAIDRLLGHEGLGLATGKSGYFRGYLPGAPKDAKILIDQLGNRMFVDALQAMREASKTGGAVGNVSDREGDRLENVIAAVTNTRLTDEEMVYQLNLAKQILETYQRDVQAAWETQFGANAGSAPAIGAEQPLTPEEQAELDELEQLYGR